MFDRLRQKFEQRLAKLTGVDSQLPKPESAIDLSVTEALRAQGNAHIAGGRLNEAESCFRAALTHLPNSTPLQICLGYALKEQGHLAEARVSLRRAVHSNGPHPDIYEAHYLLGQISEQQGEWEDALRQFNAALTHRPDFLLACADSVRLLISNKRKSDVPSFLEERIRQRPSEYQYRLMLGRYWFDVSNSQGAVDNFAMANTLGAPLTDINLPMGQALLRLNREEQSRPFLERALAADPLVAPYIDHIRAAYFGPIGADATAISLLETFIAGNHDYGVAHANWLMLLMVLSYTTLDPQRNRYVAAAKRFAELLESGPQLPSAEHERHGKNAPSQPLRVGFVAGEFKNHPILHFLLGMLENLDKSRIHTVAFSNNVYDDVGTAILKAAFDDWVDIREVDDAAAAAWVRSHNIDVLLDLCGHTGDGRLPLFAKRPAFVQATWLGYWASTGLSRMDYIIADHISIPEDSTEWFSETVWRLPGTRMCMTAPREEPPIPVSSLPFTRKGHITLGSFQRTLKLNDNVLALWGRMLRAIPSARLRIQADTIKIDSLRAELMARMRNAGLDLLRVDLVQQTDSALYLATYSEVDIILDTFPFTGGTTTAQALWMGVPTVTLRGNTMLSSQGASMLSCVGLTDWIAKDEEDYIRIVHHFANDPQHLAQLRSELRNRAEQSPLFDVKRFAQDFTDGLWNMYRDKQANCH